MLGPMNVFIGHTAACIFWLTANQYEIDHLHPTKAHPSTQSAGTQRQAFELLANTRFIDWPLSLCVPAQTARRHSRNTTLSRSSIFPPKAFLKYTQDIFIASPEFSFLQMAHTLSLDELALYGNFLCACFHRDRFSGSHMPQRNPAANIAQLAAAAKTPGVNNGKKARRAMRYITPNCASPMECLVALWLSLPQVYGGYGIPVQQCNYKINLPEDLRRHVGKSYLVADFCWPDKKLVVEYDSDLEHANPSAIAQDTIRRNALQELGFTVIGITKAQAFDEARMDRTAAEIADALGIRKRTRARLYDLKKLEMRNRTIRWALESPEKLFAETRV